MVTRPYQPSISPGSDQLRLGKQMQVWFILFMCQNIKAESMKKLKLNTVADRRNRADVIFLYKMYRPKGLTQRPFESVFQLTCFGQTRGRTLKLTKHCTNRDIRLHFFSERVINNWDLLHQMVVDSDSVTSLIHAQQRGPTDGLTSSRS